MKILAYNHNGTQLKQILRNDGINFDFENLQYSNSLQGLGSCSFDFVKKDPSYLLGLNYFKILESEFVGLERIYIEDENGNIVWGGINTDFSANGENASIKCIELKTYFNNIKAPFITLQGNGLEVISDLIEQSGSEIKLHDDCNIIDDVDIVISDNATLFDAIKSVIEATYSRWILSHEKINGLIETKLICRSILGISPAGVGVDRSRNSTEVDDTGKIFYIYDELNTERTNIKSYSASQQYNSIVSNCIVQYKDISGAEHSVESKEPISNEHESPSFMENFFGKNEKVITSLEIKTNEHAQSVANREVQQPNTSITIDLYPTNEDFLSVGDRIEFQIFSSGFITGALDEYFNYVLGSSRWRIENKNIRVSDGALEISLELSARNTTPYSYKITDKIAQTEKTARNLNSNIISG